MARSELHKRTPRACEHCRQTRRRCETPYPCRQCVSAGISCDVRVKARPQRSQQRRRLKASICQNDGYRNGSGGDGDGDGGGSSSDDLTGHNNMQTTSGTQDGSRPNHADRRIRSDTFELLKTLVQNMLLERHGYVLDCALVEPPSCALEAAGSSFSLLARSVSHPPPLSCSVQIWGLLVRFQVFMDWQDANLLDIEALYVIASTLVGHLPDASPCALSEAATKHCLPMDSVALLFGALALGSIASGELGHGRFYFDLSTEMVKRFVGHSTLQICLALFLQHVFALRVGTLNYAHGIITQAIQHAHDLDLHHNTYGVRGLQHYLLIYMADQYCSLTHNTEPVIRTSELQGQIFQPLTSAKPQLQTLVELVTINGYVIEHSQRLQRPSQDNIIELESRISSLRSRLADSAPAQPSCGGFRAAYEPLARVHMLWTPGLSEPTSWLPSLCICVHAAEGVLSTYFQLHRPVLLALVRQSSAQDACTDKSSTPAAGKLATTWRQVKRIMMSAFVVIFAYWHGEMVHEEASRYVAMARLLLEYPRWRWGTELDQAVRTLIDISRLSELELYEHTQKLLPGADEQFLQSVRSAPEIETNSLATIGVPSTYVRGTHDKTIPTSTSPQGLFDVVSDSELFDFDVNVLQNQNLFGLWETIECPVEGVT